MAKKKYKVKSAKARAKPVEPRVRKPARKKKEAGELPFGRKNYILFGIGILVIIAGFLTLWAGDITISPVLLVIGYCVIIPVAILIRGKKEKLPEPAEPVQAEGQQAPVTETGD
jgi:Flp pilus assembly protein TadB